MKRKYDGLKAIKINFGRYDQIVTSLGPNCKQIVANIVSPGGNTCSNPSSTISYMYWGDGTGGFPDP